ncbi:unnamed protein product [Clonostachys chloroleuca]|uniref:Uncharacterized protein n=1 Tax=Clonostachys chloroleuca TaxID=1926264 RepID=A0AA35LXM4_9HYPO|nr:unnamed protein product [Clonostachys chloroleuca]
MDMRDSDYILVQDFNQDWTTDPKFSLDKVPFTDGKIEAKAYDNRPIGKHPSQHYVETKFRGSLESSHMQIKEFRMRDNWIANKRTLKEFVDKVGEYEDAAEFFGLQGQTFDNMPLYMVTGIKHAKGLEYWLTWDQCTYWRAEPVGARLIVNRNQDLALWHEALPIHSGSIPEKDVVITYKIHEITHDPKTGKMRFDVYVDTEPVVPKLPKNFKAQIADLIASLEGK